MPFSKKVWVSLTLTLVSIIQCAISSDDISAINTLMYGPGLKPDKVRLPCRYFFVEMRSTNNQRVHNSVNSSSVAITIKGRTLVTDQEITLRPEIFTREDGIIIVRYKLFRSFKSFIISVLLKNEHIRGSPVVIENRIIYSDSCVCPEENFDLWLRDNGCKESLPQLEEDLRLFDKVDIRQSFKNAKKIFSPGSSSFCHYVIINNEIFRDCHGRYVDFNMFVDAVLLYLTKVVQLPDVEFLINLGDWPLVKKNSSSKRDLLPMVSWCKTRHHADILLPTYELTQASLECMGRQVLDMISVQGQSGSYPWSEKKNQAFFRGRDSRRERLDLVKVAKNHSELFDVGITNFFFFRDDESTIGISARVPFFDFFKSKYQLSLDGTVAAYRLPFLLAGNSLVLKQESEYFEHFYSHLVPYEHYIPFKADLSDVVQQIEWARSNEDQVRSIISRAQKFSSENLMPDHVFCYHAQFLKHFSKKLVNRVQPPTSSMTKVAREAPYPTLYPNECPCPWKIKINDEL